MKDYLIISLPDDYYLAESLTRALERQAFSCDFNLRDLKKPFDFTLMHMHLYKRIIAIVNKDILRRNDFTKAIKVVSEMVNPDDTHIFALKNEKIMSIPAAWKNIRIADATMGLTSELVDSIMTSSIAPVANSVSATTAVPNPQPSVAETAATAMGTTAESIPDADINSLLLEDSQASMTVQRALRYLSGNGVPQDNDRAYSLFRKAADENGQDALAFYYLGVCHETICDPVERDKAADYYRKAADLGHVPSIVRLGMVLLNSDNTDESKSLFTDARSKGNIAASYGLGIICEKDNNLEDALDYYSEAAELGHAPAQNALGNMYAEGRGVTADPNKAYQWYEMAANQGLTAAMSSFGTMLVTACDTQESFEKGEQMLRIAAERGDANAISIVAEIDRQIEEERLQQLEEQRIREKKERAAQKRQEIFSTISELASYAKGRIID